MPINRKKVIWTCLGLWLLFCAIAFNRAKFDDYVHLEGDTWEYQSMAINWARGKSLMTEGAFGDYHKDYKFHPVAEIYQPQLDYMLKKGKSGGDTKFYRTPGYIIFLGTIYKLFGVSPLIAKQIQLLLITFIAACLPFIGFNYWNQRGFIAGILSGFIFLQEYAQNISQNTGITYPAQIMTEILITFGLLIFVLAFIYWQKRKHWPRVLLLGLITGINLLIKGSTMFIVPLTLAYFSYLFIKQKLKLNVLLIFIVGVVITVAPYSIYASIKSSQLVILSTQARVVILGGNNEFAADGTWHREGYPPNNETSFYAQPKIRSLPLLTQVIVFYKQHQYLLPQIFIAKIISGFYLFKYLPVALILSIYHLLKTRSLGLPVPFLILFLNFLLLTLLTFGLPRFIQVIDFVFILTATNYLLEILIDTQHYIKKLKLF